MSVLWPFPPEEMSVTLSWLTSVLSTRTTEQRSKLRQLYPRATFRMTSYLTKDQTYFARRLAERATSEFITPDWRFPQFVSGLFDASNLTIAVDDNYFYPEAGDMAIAWQSSEKFHLFTIQSKGVNSITADVGPSEAMSKFYVMPALLAFSRSNVHFKHGLNNSNDVAITLETRKYKNLASFAPSYPSYLTYEVITDRDIFVGSHDSEIVHAVSYVDGGVGVVVLEELYDHVDLNSTLSAKDSTPLGMITREGWLHTKSGRQIPFWKPSWGEDLILMNGASSGATQISVRSPSYAVPASDLIGRHFCVDQKGNFQFFQITNALITNNIATLTISPALSADIILSQVRTVSEMNLMRLDTDEVQIRYEQGIKSSFAIQVASLDNEL